MTRTRRPFKVHPLPPMLPLAPQPTHTPFPPLQSALTPSCLAGSRAACAFAAVAALGSSSAASSCLDTATRMPRPGTCTRKQAQFWRESKRSFGAKASAVLARKQAGEGDSWKKSWQAGNKRDRWRYWREKLQLKKRRDIGV
eukprot:6183837-Pleurochrysis_carterae.AAC.4